jgi:hypothetical protein
VDITVYLPDELGERAKREEDINLSRMLRDALIDEFARRDTVSKTLSDPQTIDLNLETRDGPLRYIGRITGTMIAEGHHDVRVFLTNDERVLVYDEQKLDYHDVTDDPESSLRSWLEDGPYIEALGALGIKPVLDI